MAPIIPLGFNFRTDSDRGRFKPKSDDFEAIETALDQYVAASTVPNLRALTTALGAWKLTKVKPKTNKNWSDSIRATEIRHLSQWLVQESTAQGLFPDPGPGWGGNHNCYAFAMKCAVPQGRGCNSRPGKFADNPAAHRHHFAHRVVADGDAQNKAVLVLRRGGLPTPVPGPFAGRYLVAMVANDDGYHFMRRDEISGHWMHKNGAISNVENYFYDTSIEQPVPITNAVVGNILANPKLISCSMTFEAYLSVPTPGIDVAG